MTSVGLVTNFTFPTQTRLSTVQWHATLIDVSVFTCHPWLGSLSVKTYTFNGPYQTRYIWQKARKKFLPKKGIKKETQIQKIERQKQATAKSCHFCGAANWTNGLQMPRRKSTMNKCGKKKGCKTHQIKQIGTENDDWAPIQLTKPIHQTVGKKRLRKIGCRNQR